MITNGGDAPALPAPARGLGAPRYVAATVVLVVGLPALTAALVPERDDLAYATPVLLVLVLVVAVALLGGLRVALPAAVLGGLTLNWFFTPPYGRLRVEQSEQLVVLGVYLGVAVAVSAIVGLAARRTAEADRASAEAQALASLAGAALAEQQTLPDLLDRVRQVFGMREVLLLESGPDGWAIAASATAGAPLDPEAKETELRVPAGPTLELAVRGPALFAEDQRVLRHFAAAAATALEGRRLGTQAEAAARLAATDRVRVALLAAVGHDLRTPLAAVKAAVSGLRQSDVTYGEAERQELLETIEVGADRLQSLVENLLDASRLEAGAVSVTAGPVGLDEVVGRAVLALGEPERQRMHLDLPEGLPDVRADAGLLERVFFNLIDNALRYSPAGTIVTVRGRSRHGTVDCEIIDHGRGIPKHDREAMFTPFQQFGDRMAGGTGLGLSVAKGFADAMGATLTASSTHAGGLTMRLTLPLADQDHDRVPPL